MPVYVVKNPENLRWSDLVTTPNQPKDPSDGTLVDAYARFIYIMPRKSFMPKKIGAEYGIDLPKGWQITIRPNGKKWKDLTLPNDLLLAHEELHYFFGFLTARALVDDLLAMRTAQKGDLPKRMGQLVELHLKTRAAALNDLYDTQTNHGTDSAKQKKWQVAVDACIANAAATTLMGLDL